VIFALLLALGLLDFPFKRWLGLALFGAYGIYVRREMLRDQRQEDGLKETDRLKFKPRDPTPSLRWAALQTMVALVVTAVSSRIFLSQLEDIGTHLGVSAQSIALFLSPVVTELPETLNAVIWVRQGREQLALANISGAMMIQGTIPAGLGILFTAWRFDHIVIAAVITTACAVTLLWTMFRRSHVTDSSLIPVGLLYAVFVAAIAWMGGHHP
jgi:cation:H+ antiporter